MSPKKLKELVAEGESNTLEFKKMATTPQKLAKEFAALANTKGGILLTGVEDNGKIVGVHSEKTEIDIIEQACNFHIEPSVEFKIEVCNYRRKDVVIVYIEESQTKPHLITIQDKNTQKEIKRAYIRLGEKSVIASREMYRLMQYSRKDARPLKLNIGDNERRLFDYLEYNEKITVKQFAKLVNISERRASRILISLVRAGVIQITNESKQDYFILV